LQQRVPTTEMGRTYTCCWQARHKSTPHTNNGINVFAKAGWPMQHQLCVKSNFVNFENPADTNKE